MEDSTKNMATLITETLDKQDEIEENQVADWLKNFINQPPSDKGPGEHVELPQLSSETEPLGTAGLGDIMKNDVVVADEKPAEVITDDKAVNENIVENITNTPTNESIVENVTNKPADVKLAENIANEQITTNNSNEKLANDELVKNTPTNEPIHITPSESIEEAQSKLLNQIDQLTKDIKYTLPADYSDDKLNQLYAQFLTGLTIIPGSSLNKLDLNNYISSITTFNYNCFDTPDVLLQHNIPDKVAIVKHVNELFNTQFMDINPTHDNRYNFSKLTNSIVKYLWHNKDVGTTLLEYTIIKSFMVKLILNLNTNVELGLSNDKKINNITNQFYNAVIQDITDMKYIQAGNGKTAMSWKTFVGALLGTSDKNIYTRTNNVQLNSQLKTAFNYDFMLETMLANMLKTYVPSIILNYFYVVRSLYITVRLMSVYIDRMTRKAAKNAKNGQFGGISKEKVMTDLSAIAGLGTIIYENLSFVFRIVPRSMPTYDNTISEQFQMYITNHLVVGGQYYLLKMLEKSLPVVAELIKK